MSSTTDHSPFDDFRALALAEEKAPTDQIKSIRAGLEARAINTEGASGSILTTLARWQKELPVKADEVHVCLFVSSYAAATPIEAMRAFVDVAKKGAGAANILSQDHGLGLRIIEMAIEQPFEPFTSSEKQTAGAMAFGMEAVAAGGDLLGLGSATFGHDAFAYALMICVLRQSMDVLPLFKAVHGPVHDQMTALVAGVPDGADALEVVRLLAGPDCAAGLGAMMAARAVGMPVLIESPALLAAAVVLAALNPKGLDHVLVSAAGSEFDQLVCRQLGLVPLLGADPGAGPGAAVVQAHRLVRGACALQGLRVVKTAH